MTDDGSRGPAGAGPAAARPAPRAALARLLASAVARVPGWFWPPFAVFVFSRVAILAVTGWSLVIDPRLHRPGGRLALPALEGLCRWDCGWFQRIALDGYDHPYWSNFFPLFPLLGRVLHELTAIPVPIALVLVANLFGLVGLVVVYRLFERLEGPAVALTGISLLAAWPFSFFHAAGYPESIMLASTALAAWFAYGGRHFAGATALGLGVLGRHLTILGGGALLVAQLLERPGLKRFVWNRRFWALVLPFGIASLYLVYLSLHFGDPLSWWRARSQGWGEAAWYGLFTFFRGEWEPQIAVYVWLSLIPGAGALLLLRKRSWWILAGYGLTLMIALWSIGLMGLGRYTQACWPAFLPLAVWLERRPAWRPAVLIAFALVQGMFLYLHVHSYPIN